jgi:hypothetical protein
MIDGLKQERFLVGSTYSDYVSGMNIAVATITTTGTATLNAVVPGNADAGSNVLSSGSRWVTFNKTFPSTPYVLATHTIAAGGAVELIGVGSITTGSFIALGSTTTSTVTFNWCAFAGLS